MSTRDQYGPEGVVIDNDTGMVEGENLPASATSGLQPIVTAEINQAVATAKQFPRRSDLRISNEIAGRATLTEDIAAECNYTLKRGGKTLTGPSIRFAEVVRSAFGNIRVAARFVAIDNADPERAAVIVEAVALDVETNNSEIIPVRRSIMTSAKEGRRPQMYSADMINMTMNAGCSIARRNAILAVVPKAIWSAPYQRVIQVIRGDLSTLAARVDEMIAAFKETGVTPEMLFQALEVPDVSAIGLDHMPVARGMMTAIREGESVDSVMGRMGVTETRPHARVDSPLKDKPAEQQKPEVTKHDADGVVSEQDAERRAAEDRSAEQDQPKQDAKPAVAKKETAKQDTKQSQQSKQPYTDDASYLLWMRNIIQTEKNATALKDAWASSRNDRRELLGGEDMQALTGEYNAALVELMG